MSKAEIEIITEWCKGCEICVAICPHDVLIMQDGLAEVANLDACTACMLCELHCPDFAIKVIKKDESSK